MLEGYLIKQKNRLAIYDPSYKKVHVLKTWPRSFKEGDRVCMKNDKLMKLDKEGDQQPFKELTPIFANKALPYNSGLNERTLIYNLLAPMGLGTRALVVAPPKAGKTTVLTDLAQSIDTDKCKLIVLLVDERPEEVTEFVDLVQDKALILSSTFDESAQAHLQITRLAIARAQSLAQAGEDVVVLVDSITRICRAANALAPSNGRVGTGGLIYEALSLPKQLLGMARATREAGSITVIASCLIETGSRLDEVIFEEFKGTGNCELVLSRDLAQKGIFPAVDIAKTGTRRDDLIWGQHYPAAKKLRQTLLSIDPIQAHGLLAQLVKDKTDAAAILDKVATS